MKVKEFAVKKIPISSIKFDKTNPNVVNDDQMKALSKGMEKFGYLAPVILNEKMEVLDGEHRVKIYKDLGETKIPAYVLDINKMDGKLLRQVMNKLSGQHSPKKDADEFEILMNNKKLDELEDLIAQDVSEFNLVMQRYKDVDYGLGGVGSLARRFGIVPFDILDATSATWRERKRQWINFGLRSEEGREDVKYWNTKLLKSLPSVSIFDPVLCEISYRWFTPKKKCKILDPFAGGTVRGIIASFLGHEYHGIDLRQEQVDANNKLYNETLKNKLPKDHIKPKWYVGDSVNLDKILPKNMTFDMLLTSPPYFNQEKYSDLPQDLNNMDWQGFKKNYQIIIKECAKRMNDGAFAVWNTSDVRHNKTSFFCSLEYVLTEAFESMGMNLYNKLILMRSISSLPIHINKQFPTKRKVGRRYEFVNVYLKAKDDKDIPQIDETVVEIPQTDES